MSPIDKTITRIETSFFQRNLDVSECSGAAEHGDHSPRLANSEDRHSPFDTPSLVINDVFSIALIPAFVPHATGKTAAVRDILHQSRTFLDTIKAAADFSVIPFSSDEL